MGERLSDSELEVISVVLDVAIRPTVRRYWTNLWVELRRARQREAAYREALERAQQDINWMLNSRQFLSGHVFDYIERALAEKEET
jgi:hypothetical protein